MTAIDYVRELLHLVAGALIWPVLIGLIGLAAVMLVVFGGFLREVWQRRRGRHDIVAAARVELDGLAQITSDEPVDIRLERALQVTEARLWRAPTRLKLAVRVGPALGLMGTLIPMAYALQGLASGNLPALASNLVTAFAATVVGLAISISAYLMAAARESWARSDSQALAFHAEALLRNTAA